jgi:hypothetical protein
VDLSSDLGIGLPGGQQREHLILAGSEPGQPFVAGQHWALTNTIKDLCRDRRIQEALALPDALDRADQFRGRCRFEHVA